MSAEALDVRCRPYLEQLAPVAEDDAHGIAAKGGGAWRSLRSLWDRLETSLSLKHYDVFNATPTERSILTTLREQLLYVEAETRHYAHEPAYARGLLSVRIADLVTSDLDTIRAKDAEYGGSWKTRGGIGAYMMMARKWDRIIVQVARKGGDFRQALESDSREEGILDDVGDLRRYLLLIEAELRVRPPVVAPPEPKYTVKYEHGRQCGYDLKNCIDQLDHSWWTKALNDKLRAEDGRWGTETPTAEAPTPAPASDDDIPF